MGESGQRPVRIWVLLFLPAALLSVAAVVLWAVMQRQPDVGIEWPGPEGTSMICWDGLSRADCLARAEAALEAYRADGMEERIVVIRIAEDDQDLVCSGSQRSHSCHVTRDDREG
jgi:hypothetical protein